MPKKGVWKFTLDSFPCPLLSNCDIIIEMEEEDDHGESNNRSKR